MSNPQYPSNQPPYQPNQSDGYPNQPQSGFPPPQPGGYPPQGYQPPPPGYQPQPGYYPQPGYPMQPQYGGYGGFPGSPPAASFGQRLAATLIDSIVLLIPLIIVITIGTVLIVSSFSNVITDANNTVVSADINGGTFTLGLLIVIVGSLAIYLTYYLLMVAKGATVGDKVAGIKIVDANGNPPGAGKAFVRFLMQSFISGIFLIGYLWMLWDPNHQTLHDKAAGTFTVPANR